MSDSLIIRQLGLQNYVDVLLAMHRFTDRRQIDTPDEIWLVQHPPIFTQGKMGKVKDLLISVDIPVVKSDRGGQMTYHGPGQQVMYVMLDLHRRKLGVRDLVTLLEKMVIATLARFKIIACVQVDAPGVYIGRDKICSLGLRIHKGCSLHGLALNIDMDLSPFSCIDPCGYAGLRMTQVSHFSSAIGFEDLVPVLLEECLFLLGDFVREIQPWCSADYPA